MSEHQILASKVLIAVTDWVRSEPDIRALAVVGSHARNTAHPQSDVDLVLLSEKPQKFRDASWLNIIRWSQIGLKLVSWGDEEYGALWSRRVWFRPNCEVEFGFSSISWADANPVDRGTAEVVSDGCRILYDPDGLLERLLGAVGNA